MGTFSLDDTIVAIATPLGEGGIGIVKISGPQSIPILGQLFVSPSSTTEPPATADADGRCPPGRTG
jgi:tRNA U34 5-carboxymethylaminomethyl modifying GTPase MnmE/TrmE